MRFALLSCFFFSACSPEYTFHTPEEKSLPNGIPSELFTDEVEDRFYQESPYPVDIIFAIDQSGSMSDNTTQVALSIPSFINTLESYNLDYRIGVISTEGSTDDAGKLTLVAGGNYISPSSVNPEAMFLSMATLARGYGEAGIAASLASITKAFDFNRDFYRVGAPLSYIAISDEADQSQYINGVNQPGVSPKLLSRFFNWAEQYKEAEITFSAVSGTSDRNCENLYSADDRYKLAAELTGGAFHNICDGDWDRILNDLAEYAIERRYEYVLLNNPIEETIFVHVERGPVVLSFDRFEDWDYVESKNSIIFYEYEHQETDVVVVTYTIAGSYE